MPEENNVPTATIALAGLIATLLTFAVVILVVVMYYRTAAQLRVVKEINEPPAEWTQLRTEQQGKLAMYGTSEQVPGSMSIPIQRAKELVVQEIQKDGIPKRIVPPAPPPASGGKP